MDLTVRTQSWVGRSYRWLRSAFGTNDCVTVTLDLDRFDFTATVTNGIIPAGTVLGKVTATNKYGPYIDAGAAEVQRITITGTPDGGSFTITFNGQTTAAIAYNATAAAVQAALLALSNVDAGEITVGGGPLPGSFVTLTFGGDLTGNVNAVTTTDSLTGGTSPATAVTTTTAGTAGPADGRGTALGILFEDVDVNQVIQLSGTRDVTGDRVVPMMWHGAIIEALLPTGHGLDAAAKTDLGSHFKWW